MKGRESVPPSIPGLRLGAAIIAIAGLLPACTVGPDYKRPKIDTPEAFKSKASDGPAPAQIVPDWVGPVR
jgi:hypothetical protein